MNTRAGNLLTTLALAALIVVLAQPGPAQEIKVVQEITGTVKDATGGVLPGVLISIPQLNLVVDSDNAGRYVMKDVPPGKYMLHASLPGFVEKASEVVVQAGQNLKLDIVLEVKARADTITVEYTAPKLMTASDSIGVVSILPSQVTTLPSLGEKDVFRSIQLMPGVSASNEASSGLYVRGGTPDQNLVLFDGFTVYKVDHFYGIFSAFNANAVESTTILKGGFDAKYGGRISSVVDLVGRTNSKKEMELGGGVSLLSINAYVDGPLGKNGTYLLAARRSYPSPLSKRIRDTYSNTTTAGPGGGGSMGSFTSEPLSTFYDLNGKATYALGDKDTFTLSLYYGKDDFDNSRTMEMPNFGTDEDRSLTGEITDLQYWGNGGASLNWQRAWTPTFSSKVTLAYSRYFKNTDNSSTMTVVDPDTSEEEEFTSGSTEKNRLHDITARWQNSLILGRQHYLEFGAEATRNKVDYYYNFNADMGQIHRVNKGFMPAVYVQDRFQPYRKLEITPGIRAARFTITDKYYLEPRLSLIIHVNDRLRLKGAGGRYHQYIADLTREDPMGGDQNIWTLSDGSTVPVSRSNHYIGGASYETSDYLFDVEAYRKELKGLSQFGMYRMRRGMPPPRNENDDAEDFDPGPLGFNKLFFTGSGRADGVEVLVQKKFGVYTGWVTYTLGNVKHSFPDFSSTPYPASHDSTHEVKIVGSRQWKRFTFSGNWIFATGKPVTEPTSYEDEEMPDGRTFSRPIFSSKNGSRLPDYHRLDLSATWDFLRREGSRAQAGVSVFNAYNRANVWRRQFHLVYGEFIKTDVNYLSITASAFLNFNFDVPSDARKAGPAWYQSDAKDVDEMRRWVKPGKEYDFYGTIVSINPDRVTLRTQLGTKDFVLGRKAFLGEPNYEAGAYVHVYYREQTEGNVITMLVRKVKDSKEVSTKEVDPLDPLRPWRF